MDRQYVGIDFHRRRSVIVRLNSAGERLGVRRVNNDALEFAAAMTEAGDRPMVVIEATYGWYWAVDFLQDLGCSVHLASPKSLNWGDRRVKNDVIDAQISPTCCAWAGCPKRGSRRRQSGSCGSSCAIALDSCNCGQG
jgi:Transposase